MAIQNKPIDEINYWLPTDWESEDIITPNGVEVGLERDHGYNYLMEAVNALIQGVNDINNAIPELGVGFVEMQESLAVDERKSNTLYGLILADFNTVTNL